MIGWVIVLLYPNHLNTAEIPHVGRKFCKIMHCTFRPRQGTKFPCELLSKLPKCQMANPQSAASPWKVVLHTNPTDFVAPGNQLKQAGIWNFSSTNRCFRTKTIWSRESASLNPHLISSTPMTFLRKLRLANNHLLRTADWSFGDTVRLKIYQVEKKNIWSEKWRDGLWIHSWVNENNTCTMI